MAKDKTIKKSFMIHMAIFIAKCYDVICDATCVACLYKKVVFLITHIEEMIVWTPPRYFGYPFYFVSFITVKNKTIKI